MIFLYNIFLAVAFISILPFALLKSINNSRMLYRVKDRFIPSKKIKKRHYMLLHASSFGEIKAVLDVVDIFKKQLKKDVVFSVFTDTAHKFLKDRDALLMPLDFYPLYKKVFFNPPDVAFFFETEIWPSYITFLKNKGTKLVLINARMSDKSFKMYKIFSFLFKDIIGKFDFIIAKSEKDARRFRMFNQNTVECGNIKQFKKHRNISSDEIAEIRNRFYIKTDKPILTFGSMHKEEVRFVADAVSMLKDDFFVVIAPRHMEDVQGFYSFMKKCGMHAVKRSEHMLSNNVLLLDSMGELEDVYKISDAVFIGGSTMPFLHGHNPVEPLVYNKLVISGKYMDSFEYETREMVSAGLLKQIDSVIDLVKILKNYLEGAYKIDADKYFQGLSTILDCYIKYTIKCVN